MCVPQVQFITPTEWQVVCTAKQVGQRNFISSHRKSCGDNMLANILLDAEVEDEEEGEDPGEVRQPHHVTSHSSFHSPAYL